MSHERFVENAHALVIGISAYVHVASLPPAVREGARQVASVLADPLLGGYRPEQVQLLLDGDATREAIREALRDLARIAGPGSTVLIYFACHAGRARGDDAGDVFLLPGAADDTARERLAATAISGAELTADLAAIRAGRVLVLFDCCHAGGLADAELPSSVADGLPESYRQTLGRRRGRALLAASRPDERSWLVGEGPSVFTRHLLAALRGAAGADAGVLRVWELFEYIQPKVTGERPDQHPVLEAELEENFPIALALGGQGGAPATDEDDGFQYDVYLSYADCETDARRVWDVLVPHLEAAGLSVAVAGDVEAPGVYRVVAAERGIARARRTVIVLSDDYLEDGAARFVEVLSQTVGIEQGLARLLPVRFGAVSPERLPARLRMLVSLDLAHPRRGGRNLNRLVRALHAPVPRLAAREI